MIRVRDLRTLGSFSVDALRKAVGPFALVQSPPSPVMQQVAKTLMGSRTVTMANKTRLVEQILRAMLAFDTMMVLTPVSTQQKDLYLIGRNATCDLVVHDPSVSSRHAKLTWDGTVATIEDVGSTNGTFVNALDSERKPVALKDGDTVALGDAAFVYVTVDSLHAALRGPPRR